MTYTNTEAFKIKIKNCAHPLDSNQMLYLEPDYYVSHMPEDKNIYGEKIRCTDYSDNNPYRQLNNGVI
jgi:hypothetical protein